MQLKILEIRDAGTFVAVMAISIASDDHIQGYYLRRDGYSVDGSIIMIVRLNDGGASNDPYKWSEARGRTMNEAHVYRRTVRCDKRYRQHGAKAWHHFY